MLDRILQSWKTWEWISTKIWNTKTIWNYTSHFKIFNLKNMFVLLVSWYLFLLESRISFSSVCIDCDIYMPCLFSEKSNISSVSLSHFFKGRLIIKLMCVFQNWSFGFEVMFLVSVILSWCILPSVVEISAADFSSDKLLNNLILCMYLNKMLT